MPRRDGKAAGRDKRFAEHYCPRVYAKCWFNGGRESGNPADSSQGRGPGQLADLAGRGWVHQDLVLVRQAPIETMPGALRNAT